MLLCWSDLPYWTKKWKPVHKLMITSKNKLQKRSKRELKADVLVTESFTRQQASCLVSLSLNSVQQQPPAAYTASLFTFFCQHHLLHFLLQFSQRMSTKEIHSVADNEAADKAFPWGNGASVFKVHLKSLLCWANSPPPISTPTPLRSITGPRLGCEDLKWVLHEE